MWFSFSFFTENILHTAQTTSTNKSDLSIHSLRSQTQQDTRLEHMVITENDSDENISILINIFYKLIILSLSIDKPNDKPKEQKSRKIPRI